MIHLYSFSLHAYRKYSSPTKSKVYLFLIISEINITVRCFIYYAYCKFLIIYIYIYTSFNHIKSLNYSASGVSIPDLSCKDEKLVWKVKIYRPVGSLVSRNSIFCPNNYLAYEQECEWCQDCILHQLHHFLFTDHEALHG